MTDSSPSTHAVLVTFRRHDVLTDHLRRLAAQTQPLTTLTVMDNDADPEIEALVASATGQAAATRVDYVAMADNAGPAGGFRAGVERVLADAADDDVIVLLDDNDPPWRDDTFEALMDRLAGLVADDDTTGGIAVFGASLTGNGRLRVATGVEPEPVDYLSGAGCPHYRVAALRAAPGPAADLFFGFEELDLGLALRRAGYRLWSSGLARDHGCADYVEPSRAAIGVSDPSWRRYYSVRNLVTVLRKDGRTADAVFVSAAAGIGKPLLNLPLRPRTAWANLRLTAPAVADAWRGRLGRRVEPAA